MGGGGGGTDVETTNVTNEYKYDPKYTKKLAEIAERQQTMAEDQWQMYKTYAAPYEIEAFKANRELLPLITEASKTTLGIQPEVTKEFYRQATEGVDVERRMDEAAAEVRSASGIGQQMRRREISRLGIDPNSSAFANLANQTNLETSKAIAGARNIARSQAEQEKFSRIGFSLGRGIYQTSVGPATDPYTRAAASYAASAGTMGSLANRVMSSTQTQTYRPASSGSGWGTAIGGAVGAIGGYFAGGNTMQGAQAGYEMGSGIGGLF